MDNGSSKVERIKELFARKYIKYGYNYPSRLANNMLFGAECF